LAGLSFTGVALVPVGFDELEVDGSVVLGLEHMAAPRLSALSETKSDVRAMTVFRFM
jgi:hypothetical protein